MKKIYNTLAFDFGATSGRAVLCSFIDGKIELTEVHRFNNTPIEKNGILYWDFAFLFSELKKGLKIAAKMSCIDSIGIDTWGVDFGLIGKDGQLLQNPVHYRNRRTDNIAQEVYKIINEEKLYSRTGICAMTFNTLFQIAALKKYEPALYDKTEKILLMPDLFAYMLTGNMTAEKSIASTTQLMDSDGSWDWEIINSCGIKTTLFPDIAKSGTPHGVLNKDICRELNIPPIPVYNVCGHDTANAVFCAPQASSAGGYTAYLSSGTWSLLGTTLDKPLINKNSFAAGYTNERGYDGEITFHKNIMGLWLISECLREWNKSGHNYSYTDIDSLAASAEENYIIDVFDSCFISPGNMPDRIKTYLSKKYRAPANTISIAETARCIYDSLAKKYCDELTELELLTGQKYTALNILGGGSKSAFLCALTAKKCRITVIAGPEEATSLGNAAIQLIALGAIHNAGEARQIVKNSTGTKLYTPNTER